MRTKIVSMSQLAAKDTVLVEVKERNYIGINAAGRIGKLSVRHHAKKIKNGESPFDGIVVNFGRQVGSDSAVDAMNSLLYDSTYGRMQDALGLSLFGNDILRVGPNMFEIGDVPVKLLFQHRNPNDIPWKNENVNLVIDTSGVFKDPSAKVDPEDKKGVFRGHVEGNEYSADYAIFSAPFKTNGELPEDAFMTVMGINDGGIDLSKHKLFSPASCTTTGLCGVINPVVNSFGADRLKMVDVATIHAVTNSQSLLDSVPGKGKTDLRKNRAALDNIIFTTTGAAKALKKVISTINNVPFNADSWRVPTKAPSMLRVQMVLSGKITAEEVHAIYKKASDEAKIVGSAQRGKLNTQFKLGAHYNSSQLTAIDYLGFPALSVLEAQTITVQHVNMGTDANPNVVTVVNLVAGYDNEFGSYTNAAGTLADSIGFSIN